METLALENWYIIVVPIFGAAYAAPNIGTRIFIGLGLSLNSAKFLHKIVEFKDFSRLLSDFPVI